MTPQEIESQSFKIIEAEAGPHNFMPEQWPIVRRMIHTSADFDYLQSVRFHPLAVTCGIAAIKNGNPIITDTNMARTGIRRHDLERFGVEVRCLITDPDVAAAARRNGTTRAQAAVDAAATSMVDGIYVIGNAPTALLRLIALVNAGRAQPALIVGLPVGFVNAAESKADLLSLEVPYITNTGRKGGSTVAASVINALALMAAEE
ncbi:MAG: precorrin-8X methylmutase [Deltaproteobacteria bacterium]|nr:precorrin-8X methylmutase [Deltaproteobacteria bacterium]